MTFSFVANTRVENRYLSATLPPEPHPGSVALDKDGIAWQRGDENWNRPDCVVWDNGTRWLVLLAEHGPVRLLHDAPADEPECAVVDRAEKVEKVDEVADAEEPSIGSVVRDSEDDTWTRTQDGRWFYDGLKYSWSALIREYGPITILLRAEATA